MTKSQQDLRSFLLIAQEQALAEARTTPSSLEIKRRARALVQFARDQLAQAPRDDVRASVVRESAGCDAGHSADEDVRNASEDAESTTRGA